MPHLQTISGDVANLRIIAKVPGVRILRLNSLKPGDCAIAAPPGPLSPKAVPEKAYTPKVKLRNF